MVGWDGHDPEGEHVLSEVECQDHCGVGIGDSFVVESEPSRRSGKLQARVYLLDGHHHNRSSGGIVAQEGWNTVDQNCSQRFIGFVGRRGTSNSGEGSRQEEIVDDGSRSGDMADCAEEDISSGVKEGRAEAKRGIFQG